MQRELFNSNWKFWVEQSEFAVGWKVHSIARDVTLPHDAMIEEIPYSGSDNHDTSGHRDSRNYIYQKSFYVNQEDLGKIMALRFEGSYMNTFVYLNGNLVGKHHYGYTGFTVPLNNFLVLGENFIRVVVRNGAMANSRWYSGGGLYRDVYLCRGNDAHFDIKGVYVDTLELVDREALIEVKVPINNVSKNPVSLKLRMVIKDQIGKVIYQEQKPYYFMANDEQICRLQCFLGKVHAWSCENPYLYEINCELFQDGQIIDHYSGKFGVRTIFVDPKRGLRINGKTVKLKGACIHHDGGLIGAATFEDCERRRIRKLKEAGFNSIRMAHHPASPVLLKVCDELGMYVMDEAFDMWTRFKTQYDYAMFFSDHWKKDILAMVEEDVKHPSVILYSIGNEIQEVGTLGGNHLTKLLNDYIKSLDDTRPTLASINGLLVAGDFLEEILKDIAISINQDGQEGDLDANVNQMMTQLDMHMSRIVTHPLISKKIEKACAGVDVAGYNYMSARYEKDICMHPNRIIVGSETYPPEIASNWKLVLNYPNIIGDFTWTGWDYLGEAGVAIPAYQPGIGGFGAPYPSQLAYVGDIDITGFRRPLSYYREIVFGQRQKPYIAVRNPYHSSGDLLKTPWMMSDTQSSWTWNIEEAQMVTVEVYAPGDELELYLNDKLIERKKIGNELDYVTIFNLPYSKGELKAVNYLSGEKIAESFIKTAEVNQETIRIVVEKDTCDLKYIQVTLVDDQGIIIPNQDKEIEINLVDAELLGFGTANPRPLDVYFSNKCTTFQGRALAIVKKLAPQSEIKVSTKNYQKRLVF